MTGQGTDTQPWRDRGLGWETPDLCCGSDYESLPEKQEEPDLSGPGGLSKRGRRVGVRVAADLEPPRKRVGQGRWRKGRGRHREAPAQACGVWVG